jgi:hypothetical protein
MSNKKQTVVDWLVNEMPVIDWQDPYWKIKLDKAKEMEKQQIIDACNQIEVFGADHELPGEQYYEETYEQ